MAGNDILVVHCGIAAVPVVSTRAIHIPSDLRKQTAANCTAPIHLRTKNHFSFSTKCNINGE